MDFLIKSSRSYSCWVKRIFMVSCSNDDDIIINLKSIHFSKQLIDCTPTWASFISKSSWFWEKWIDLIYKNDARLVLLSFFKQFSNSFSSNSHKHLIKVTSSAVIEIGLSFSSNCSGNQCFSSSWLSKQQNSFVKLCSNLSVLSRIFDHLNHILNFFFDLVNSFYITQSLFDFLCLLKVKWILLHHWSRSQAFKDQSQHKSEHEKQGDLSNKTSCFFDKIPGQRWFISLLGFWFSPLFQISSLIQIVHCNLSL